MFTLHKSAVFMRQWQDYAQDYKNRAGMAIAERFIVAVEEALYFIIHNPYACAIWEIGEEQEYEILRHHQFRKWNLRHFPHVILFRRVDNSLYAEEVLYAHKMDISSRLEEDIDSH